MKYVIVVLFVHSGTLYLILGFGWISDNIQYQKYAKVEKIQKVENTFPLHYMLCVPIVSIFV
jgi:Na+/H+ antiporter NhaC